MDFSKIKYTEKAGVELVTKIKVDGATEHRVFECADAPRPELPAALEAFREFVLDLWPLDDQLVVNDDGTPALREDGTERHILDDLVITSLSIDEEEKTHRLGLIVTALLPIDKANGRPLVINTPRMREWEDNGEEQPKGTFDQTIVELIDAAQTAASAYYRGERGQEELFDEKTTTEAASAPAAEPEKKKRRRRGKAVVDGLEVVNPEKTKPYSTAYIADLLERAGRKTALEEVMKLTSSEREEAVRWAEAVLAEGGDGEQPDVTAAENGEGRDLIHDNLPSGIWPTPPRAGDVDGRAVAAAAATGD